MGGGLGHGGREAQPAPRCGHRRCRGPACRCRGAILRQSHGFSFSLHDSQLFLLSNYCHYFSPTLPPLPSALFTPQSMVSLRDLLHGYDSEALSTEQPLASVTGADLRSSYLLNSTLAGSEEADLVLLVRNPLPPSFSRFPPLLRSVGGPCRSTFPAFSSDFFPLALTSGRHEPALRGATVQLAAAQVVHPPRVAGGHGRHHRRPHLRCRQPRCVLRADAQNGLPALPWSQFTIYPPLPLGSSLPILFATCLVSHAQGPRCRRSPISSRASMPLPPTSRRLRSL